MFTDVNNVFSAAQVITGSQVLSTNVIDLGPLQAARNAMGALVTTGVTANGNEDLHIQVNAGNIVIGTGSTLRVEVISSPNSDMSSSTAHAIHELPINAASSNTALAIEPDIPVICQRYVALRYTPIGSFTSLPLTAQIVPQRQTNR